MSIIEILEEMNEKLIVTDDQGVRKYKIIKNYTGTYIEKQMKEEETMIYPFFRVFTAAKPERNRKLNVDLEHDFDPYNDSLLDYASIIAHYLKKPWQNFNRLISIHIPQCPNDCWYCYVPKSLYVLKLAPKEEGKRYVSLTAKEIVKCFIDQKEVDEAQGKKSNVLRITGGEPFLLPELILECLEEIEKKNREKDIFVWTETDLLPFVERDNKSFMTKNNRKNILDKISKYENIAVHPCFHGINEDEFNIITGKKYNITLDDQITALDSLLKSKIEIYPTFSSNTCNPRYLPLLFNKLYTLSSDLPLRVALIEYKLDYPPIEARLNKDIKRNPSLYSQFTSLRIWNQLLLQHYGIGYSIIPRHLADPLSPRFSQEKIEPEANFEQIVDNDQILFLFKASFDLAYHQEVLKYLALPSGHICETEFRKKWIQGDLFHHMRLRPDQYINKKAIWIYANQSVFRLLPIREVKILKIEEAGDVISIKFKLGRLISWDTSKEEDLNIFYENLNRAFIRYFGIDNLPQPKERKPKFVFIGENPFAIQLMEKISKKSNGYNIYKPMDKVNLSKHFIDEEMECPKFDDDLSSFGNILPSLIEDKNMKNSLFYRIDIPEDWKKQSEKNKSKNDTIYEIKGGDEFSVKLEYRLPNIDQFRDDYKKRIIGIESTSDFIEIIGQSDVILTKYGSRTINFRVKKVSKIQEAVIKFSRIDNEFYAAKIILKVRVKPKKVRDSATAAIGSLLFFAGAGSISLLQQAYSTEKPFIQIIKDFFWNPSSLFLIIPLLLFACYFYLYPRVLNLKA